MAVAADLNIDSGMLMLFGKCITKAILCFPLDLYSLKTYSVPPNFKFYVILMSKCERNNVTVAAF